MNGSPSILVATPGRLKDYLSEPETAAKLSDIRTLVLDEADTMLESGFLPDVTAILRLLPPKKTSGWQGMCFSATIPAKIKTVINCVLAPGYTNISTIDKNEPPTLVRVPQYHVLIPSVSDTFNALAALLSLETTTTSKIVVFGITANLVALFAKLYSQSLTPLKVYALHSRLNQNIRTRTTDDFKAAASGLMFASDVIGRGMDFPNVDLVIQVGLPSNGEQYIHRVGRTARAGADGRAIILLTQGESFFLTQNRQLPIQPHAQTTQILADAATKGPHVEQALYAIDEAVKQRAYSSYLGFFAGSGLMKPLRLDKAGLVQMANDFAVRGMKCPEPPPMEKRTIGKMGLKGVPGFTYASAGDMDRDWGYAGAVAGGRGERGVLKPRGLGVKKRGGRGGGGGGGGSAGGGLKAGDGGDGGAGGGRGGENAGAGGRNGRGGGRGGGRKPRGKANGSAGPGNPFP